MLRSSLTIQVPLDLTWQRRKTVAVAQKESAAAAQKAVARKKELVATAALAIAALAIVRGGVIWLCKSVPCHKLHLLLLLNYF